MTISGDNVTLSSSTFSSVDNDSGHFITCSSLFSQSTTYKIKVLTQITDLNSNPIAANYKHTSGFTTWAKATSSIIKNPTTFSENGMCDQSGSTQSAKYFAYPFTTGTVGVTAKFVGLSIKNGADSLVKVSIFSESGGEPNTLIGSTSNITADDYLGDLMNILGSPFTNRSTQVIQAYFGSTGVSLNSNTNYYVVYEYSSNVSRRLQVQDCSATTLAVNSKYSTDLNSWTDWSGGSSANAANKEFLFILAN